MALKAFPSVENFVERKFTKKLYGLVKKYENERLDAYEKYITIVNLKLLRGKQELVNGIISSRWSAVKSLENHKTFDDKMLKNQHIIAFDF